jgi:BASS family bile acid:Na+ symporter
MIDKCLKTYNNLFALWIVLGGLWAYFFPNTLIPFKKYMELFFGLTMFGIGAVLQLKDFKNIIKSFWVVIIGVCAQFTIMPFSAYLISKMCSLSKEFSLGLILTGAAPGAMASNVVCFLAGADIAYSVSLTTVSTLLSPIFTPLLTFLLAKETLDVSFWDMFWSVVKMVVMPLLLGFSVRHYFNKPVASIQNIFPTISVTFIVFICSLVIALNKTYILKMNLSIFFVVVALNFAGLFFGYLVGLMCNFDELKKRALTIEIGMQNAGLGSVLALKHFSEKTALPAVVFVFVCIFTASILTQVWGRK